MYKDKTREILDRTDQVNAFIKQFCSAYSVDCISYDLDSCDDQWNMPIKFEELNRAIQVTKNTSPFGLQWLDEFVGISSSGSVPFSSCRVFFIRSHELSFVNCLIYRISCFKYLFLHFSCAAIQFLTDK